LHGYLYDLWDFSDHVMRLNSSANQTQYEMFRDLSIII
jgi:hypothetical protein